MRHRLFLIGLLFLITKMLESQNFVNSGLNVGDNAHLFEAVNQYGETVKLSGYLPKGKTVIIFYRGHWCPVCNKHLKVIQDSLELIYEKGAQVIAVSPEKPFLLKKTANKTSVEFNIVHDEDFKICDAYGVTFKPDEDQINLYNTMLGADLENAHSDDSERLPIPATYIIDQLGKVIWRHFDPDYKKRSSVKDILKHL